MIIIESNSQPLNESGKIVVASVSVFFVTFTLAFTVGFVTGHCCHKQKRKSSESREKNLSPSYNVAAPPTTQELEIYQNVAYSTVQPVNTDT